jgi:hypothetical protein
MGGSKAVNVPSCVKATDSYCAQPKNVCSKKVNVIISPLLQGVTRPIIPP